MATVNTVLGTIDSSEMGFTLPHEHLIDSSAGIRISYGELELSDRSLDMAIEDFSKAKAGGVDTVVEVSPMDLGRDVVLMRQVSEATGMNIVCCTGCWLDIPRSFWWRDKDFIADLWVREVEEGIDGTDIKAGIIKVATSDPITEHEELMLRASARTHLRTGIPITTHTPPMSRIGEAAGQDPDRGGRGAAEHLRGPHQPDPGPRLPPGAGAPGRLAGLGHQQRLRPPPPAAVGAAGRVPQGPAGRGHRVQHDAVPRLERGAVAASATSGFPSRDQNPDGFLWLSNKFIPHLMEMGVQQETVDRMMIENPRRHFESVKPEA